MSLPLLVAAEESGIGAGPIGLLILLLMVIATFLLIRNMSARIKRLPPEFPDAPRDEDEPTPGDPRAS